MSAYEAFPRGTMHRGSLRDTYGHHLVALNPRFERMTPGVLRQAERGEAIAVVLRRTAKLEDRLRVEQIKAGEVAGRPAKGPPSVASVTQAVSKNGTRLLADEFVGFSGTQRTIVAGIPSTPCRSQDEMLSSGRAQGPKKVIDFAAKPLPRARDEFRQLAAASRGVTVDAVARGAERQGVEAERVVKESVQVLDCVRVHGEEIGRLARCSDDVCIVTGFVPLTSTAMLSPDLHSVLVLHGNPVDDLGPRTRSHATTSFIEFTKYLFGLAAHALQGLRGRDEEEDEVQISRREEADDEKEKEGCKAAETPDFWVREDAALLDVPLDFNCVAVP
eukprot:Hpha_TRINITY_DN15896_c2_g14::TRINITY_DN15896_c2_g14_i1::g.191977::m.191977